MKQKEKEKLFEDAVELWGEDLQLLMVVEECAELQKAVIKLLRGKDEAIVWVAHELADVEIMLEQLRHILRHTKFGERADYEKEQKLLKLKHMIKKEKRRRAKAEGK